VSTERIRPDLYISGDVEGTARHLDTSGPTAAAATVWGATAASSRWSGSSPEHRFVGNDGGRQTGVEDTYADQNCGDQVRTFPARERKAVKRAHVARLKPRAAGSLAAALTGAWVDASERGDTLSALVDAKPIDVPSRLVLPDELPAVDVLILPREVSHGNGLYDDSVITLAKELRAAGVNATYQHDPSSRRWIGEKHVDPLVLDIIAGFITNAGWTAMVAMIAGRKSERVRVRFGRRKDPSGGLEEWFEVEGPGAEVAEALKGIQQGGFAAQEDEDGD
jgi:hypothetical protein